MSIELVDPNIYEIKKYLENIDSEYDELLSSELITIEQINLIHNRLPKIIIKMSIIRQVIKDQYPFQKLPKINAATLIAIYEIKKSIIPSIELKVKKIENLNEKFKKFLFSQQILY